jgi:Flp pilus assembly pilin Flp
MQLLTFGAYWDRRPPVKRLAIEWIRDDRGQDIVEYTLLVAFVAFASAALFSFSGGSIKGIWCNVNDTITKGQAEAS